MTSDDAREWNDPAGVESTDAPTSSSSSTGSGSGDVRVGVVVLGGWLLAYAGFLAYGGEHALSITALGIAVVLYVSVTLANVLAAWLAALVGGELP